MPLPDDHSLVRLARQVSAQPGALPAAISLVRGEDFQRALVDAGEFLPVASALFAAGPLAEPPIGLLVGLLAFEMADTSQDASQAGITGRRALQEPVSTDELSMVVRRDLCTRLLSRNTTGEDDIQRAELYLHRARCLGSLREFEQAAADCSTAIATFQQLFSEGKRDVVNKLATSFKIRGAAYRAAGRSSDADADDESAAKLRAR